MRSLALAILAIGTVSVAGPAAAQTYAPGLSGLSARVRTGHLLRMPLHVAGSVQRVGIRPPGPVRDQSLCRERR